tara:strand:- start:67829 stop:68755 length:927 start_codon:yes stop_codon:yes gene_type:complete
MKVAIIGAGGFIGTALTRKILQNRDVRCVSLMDSTDFPVPDDHRIETVRGSFADPCIRRKVVDGADKVILLAAILGGAAESNYDLSRQINVDATLDLFEYLRLTRPDTRVVFASTIAVYAEPLPAIVDDCTPFGPTMVYGAQKLMMEIALSNFQRRGWLDGVAIRPSGVMARDGADARLKTAFMSRVFYAVKRGEDLELPVAPQSTTWLTSVDTVSSNFSHAAFLSARELGNERAFTLPALRLSFEELVAALFRKYPESRSRITYAPNDQLISLFGAFPQLVTETADRLGFQRDADADDLVARALSVP